jgi:hypothetical protein
MFKTEAERLYFEKDYPNDFENISLQHKNKKTDPQKYSYWREENVLNSKIMVFQNQKIHYLSLDCDCGISKLNPIIRDFLNQYNIVYFITIGSWTEGKPTDSASLCIKFAHYKKELHKRLNKLFIVVSRLPNGEMSCDPLAVGIQMKSVFTDQMESQYYNMGGNVFDIKKLYQIAYIHFNKEWNDVEYLADQYRSEAYYKKYKEMMRKDFEEIDFSKLEKYYQNMSKHNYKNWLFDQKEIDNEFDLILEKFKSLPYEKRIEVGSKKTLIKDYMLIKWCKYDGYEKDLNFFAAVLKKRFNITSKKQIKYIAMVKYQIEIILTSNKYLDFVSLIEGDGLIAVKNKLNECRTKERKRIKPTKKHKTHKNKVNYIIERDGVTKEVKAKDRAAFEKRGWVTVDRVR